MSKRANSIVDMIVSYIILSVFVYAFGMLYVIVKYAVLTAIDKLKRRKNNEC